LNLRTYKFRVSGSDNSFRYPYTIYHLRFSLRLLFCILSVFLTTCFWRLCCSTVLSLYSNDILQWHPIRSASSDLLSATPYPAVPLPVRFNTISHLVQSNASPLLLTQYILNDLLSTVFACFLCDLVSELEQRVPCISQVSCPPVHGLFRRKIQVKEDGVAQRQMVIPF
jgi:hypothetical protein